MKILEEGYYELEIYGDENGVIGVREVLVDPPETEKKIKGAK